MLRGWFAGQIFLRSKNRNHELVNILIPRSSASELFIRKTFLRKKGAKTETLKKLKHY